MLIEIPEVSTEASFSHFPVDILRRNSVWTVTYSKSVDKMTSKFVILACIAVAWAASLSESEHEPQCYSRFDYEYKVVQKLVDLDNGQKEQKGNNVAQSDKIEAIEAEMENINSTSHEKLQKLENFNREQMETTKELRTVLDEVKNQNKALLAEIEKLKDKPEENRGIKLFLCFRTSPLQSQLK